MTTTDFGASTATRPVSISREGSTFRLIFAYNPSLVERAQALPFASFDQETKSWTAQVCTQSVEQLRGWYQAGLTDVSVDSLVAPTETLPTLAPAILRPGSLRRPYQVALAIRDDRIYARLRAIPGATWVRETKAISYPPSAAAALAELVERGTLSDPDKLLSASAVVVTFDARTGAFKVRGDERAERAFGTYFPTTDVVAAWRKKGLDVGFSDAFTEEVYRGELARVGEGVQPVGLRATLWPYQAQSVAVALERSGFGVFHEMGLGKALHVETPVLTPWGYKPIGALTLGEEVIGSNGRPTTVTGVYPQGVRPLFRIVFSDGATCLADEQHLWTVTDSGSEVQETLTVEEILHRGLLRGDRPRFTIPVVAPVNLHPLTEQETDGLCLPSRAKITERLARLARLVTECGQIREDRGAQSFELELLADNVPESLDLIRSLGGIATPLENTPANYVQRFRLALPLMIKDGLDKLHEVDRDLLSAIDPSPARHIVGITAVAPDEAVCIKVSAPDELFVIKDYIVTHNTVIAIAAGHELMFNRHEVPRTVVVVPGSVRTQWAQEIERFSDGEVVVIDGDLKKRKALYAQAKDARWLVVHYDVLSRDYALVAPLVTGSLLVADESHRLKNPTSKRTKTMRQLATKAARRLALTGTPIQNDPGEWYSVISGFVSPGAFGSPTDFLNRYAYPSRFGGYEGARNLGELRERSATYYIRNVKAEVATHLPPLRVQHRPLDVDPVYKSALMRAHREARDEIKAAALERANKAGKTGHVLDGLDVEEVETGAEMTAVGMLRLLCSSPRIVEASDSTAAQALVEAGLLPDDDGPKLDELRTLATELQQEGHRVVVFTFSKRMANLIAERLTEDGVRHVLFTGDTSKADRDQAVAAFTAAPTPEDPGPTVFVATDAGGEGLNLGKHCSLLVNMDIPWTPGILAQRSARIHRLDGTAEKYLVINFTLKGTIEEGILRMIERKADLQDAIFGEGGGRSRTTGRGGKSFFDEAMIEWEKVNGQ